jgi:hypothetical protein
LRRGTGFAALTLAWVVRRVDWLAPEAGFLVFRLILAALFFER